ncbi:hypothetical protein LINPERHAP1_LOCUS3993 [Linum perenne]
MDGCPTVLRHYVGSNVPMRMWKFLDYNKEKSGTSTISTSEKDWTRVKIAPPSHIGISSVFTYYHSIPGIDLMIFETYGCPLGYNLVHGVYFTRNVKFARFYAYNLKNKTFSEFKVEGISFLPDDCYTECAPLVESLLSVEKKLQPKLEDGV